MIHRIVYGILLFAISTGLAGAVEINLAGLSTKKAILIIGDNAPKAMSVGETSREGVRLVNLGEDSAVVEYASRQQILRIGALGKFDSDQAAKEVVLYAGDDGHFYANGVISDVAIRFLVDTGATSVALGRQEARLLGIDTKEGRPVISQTVNGMTKAVAVTLDQVTIGSIKLRDVEAVILDTDLQTPLLGMSFLKQLDVRYKGSLMTLKQSF